jgi:hypothetical protein
VFLPVIESLLDASGRLRDPELVSRLKRQATGFVAFVERIAGVNLHTKNPGEL